MDKDIKDSIISLLSTESAQIGLMQWYAQGGSTDELIDLMIENKVLNDHAGDDYYEIKLGNYTVDISTESSKILTFEEIDGIFDLISDPLEYDNSTISVYLHDEIKFILNKFIEEYELNININNY